MNSLDHNFNLDDSAISRRSYSIKTTPAAIERMPDWTGACRNRPLMGKHQ